MESKSLYIDIIEDNPLTAAVLEKMFENIGNIESHIFLKMDDFFNDKNHVPDIIILDHFMGLDRGIDSIPLIKKKFPKANIVVLSSQLDVEKMKEAFDHGANQYFKKEEISSLQIKEYVQEFIDSRNLKVG